MTPHSSNAPKHDFTRAAKKDDTEAMRKILTATPEDLSPIGVPELYMAFSEALRDNRMATADFLLRETRLVDVLSEEVVTAQAQHFGRTINLPKAP